MTTKKQENHSFIIFIHTQNKESTSLSLYTLIHSSNFFICACKTHSFIPYNHTLPRQFIHQIITSSEILILTASRSPGSPRWVRGCSQASGPSLGCCRVALWVLAYVESLLAGIRTHGACWREKEGRLGICLMQVMERIRQIKKRKVRN